MSESACEHNDPALNTLEARRSELFPEGRMDGEAYERIYPDLQRINGEIAKRREELGLPIEGKKKGGFAELAY